jgi:hypothetical protein
MLYPVAVVIEHLGTLKLNKELTVKSKNQFYWKQISFFLNVHS